MPAFAVVGNRTLSANTTILSLVAQTSGLKRFRITDFVFGAAEATPGDFGNLWQLQRVTAAGTSTAVTPKPLDPADTACSAAAGENHSAEPTYTSGEVMYEQGVNQRATMRWVAKDGCELVAPATNASGFGVRTPTVGSGVAATALLHFIE